MSAGYQAVSWNRQKRIYDTVLAAGVALYLGLFLAAGAVLFPEATAETLLIRALGTASLLLLHVIVAIGPLCRLDPRFLPLLYNRRHLGVTMFVLGLAHGVFSLIQFHALGNLNPVVSMLTTEGGPGQGLGNFPFQPLGAAALVILFLMAATSHDFWLHNLTAPVWKRLHMLVYVAYALLVGHVLLGALMTERHPLLAAALGVGMAVILGLHIAAGWREYRRDREGAEERGATPGGNVGVSNRDPGAGARRAAAGPGGPARAGGPALHRVRDEVSGELDGYIYVGEVGRIPEKRALVASIGGERIAVFRYDGKVSAISNVCQHQNGPLGEGRIIDGCVTCPWHGYQYLPETGGSPPPFTEKVPTFRVRIREGKVYVDPRSNPPGTRVEPALIEADGGTLPHPEPSGARVPDAVAR